MTPICYTCFKSQFGWIGIARSVAGVTRVVFGKTSESEVETRLLNGHPCHKSRRDLAEEIHQLKEYFDGERVDFTLDLNPQTGTEFQRSVWDTTRAIRYGNVRSYGWIAREIRNPKAARAVGTALGANPLPILVPCHRVIRSNGELGGFGGGLHWKRKLLDLEQNTLRI